MNSWPPPSTATRETPLPPPIVWAPRLRRCVQRGFLRMDRREARRLAAINQTAVDWEWRRQYTYWWNEHGWSEGAPTPEQAWDFLVAERKQGRWPATPWPPTRAAP